MNELRILSGGKRGAALALSEGSISIGIGFDSALMMSPGDIGDSCLTIDTSSRNEYSLSDVTGDVLMMDGSPALVKKMLEVGQAIKMGNIWISIAHPSSPWSEALPEIQIAETIRPTVSSEDSAISQTIGPDQTTETAVSDSSNPELEKKAIKRKGVVGSTGLNMLMLALLSVGLANCAFSEKQKTPEADNAAVIAHEIKLEEARARLEALTSKQNIKKSERLVTKMLSDREIMNAVVTGSAEGISIEGNLSRDNSEKLDRMINRAEAVYPTIQISNNTNFVEDSLPFEIVSVAFGPNSKLMLQHHGVISIGQTILGYRLDSITKDQIHFSGKQDLAISW